MKIHQDPQRGSGAKNQCQQVNLFANLQVTKRCESEGIFRMRQFANDVITLPVSELVARRFVFRRETYQNGWGSLSVVRVSDRRTGKHKRTYGWPYYLRDLGTQIERDAQSGKL